MHISRKNQHVVDQHAKALLLACMDVSGYDVKTATDTPQKLAAAVLDIFKQEKGWQIEKQGEQVAALEWLQGLASACSIPFYNGEIITLGKLWGAIPENATEKQEEKWLALYWPMMASKLLQLFSGYRFPNGSRHLVLYYIYSENIHTGEKTYFEGVDGEYIVYDVWAMLEQLKILADKPCKNTQFGAVSVNRFNRERAI